VWLQTRGGVWFIPTQGRLLFICRRSDVTSNDYWVGVTGSPSSMDGGYWVTKEPIDMTMAMALAQERAENEDSTVARRDAKWRKSKASKDQLWKAAGLGLDVEESMRRGPVSVMLSIHYATRILDPKIGYFIDP
jgi:hypothetical protein